MANTSRQSTRGLFIALFIIGLGVVLLLDQQGVISANWDLVWPAALIFFGLENIFCRGCRTAWGWVLLVAGAALLVSDLGFLRLHIGINDVWAVLLIALGVLMLFRRSIGNNWIRVGWIPTGLSDRLPRPFSNSASLAPPDAQFDHVALFSGIKRRIAVPNFRGGRLLAIFGGFNLDLTKSDIETEAVIQVDAVFGGGEIRVPDTWFVDVQASAVLGAYTDETHQISSAGTAKRLIIRGSAVFGGVVIKN